MVPHTCRACGHVYGENNIFVQTTHCCPICGAKIRRSKKGWRSMTRIVMAAGLILIAGVIYFIAFIANDLL